MKKTLSLLLAALMAMSVLAGCGDKKDDTSSSSTSSQTESSTESSETEEKTDVVAFEGDYTYKDSVSLMPTNWNSHTYQTTDDSYPHGYIQSNLYSFIYNDELHPLDGKDPYTGYVIVPDMAAGDPVDVTEAVKAEHPEFGIPESATAAYAYTIDLNPDVCWENGTPINADTYVESVKRLLDPRLLNYRAADSYEQTLSIAGAESYANQGQKKIISLNTVIANEGLESLDALLEKYKDVPAYINWANSFGVKYDFDNFADFSVDGFALEPTGETEETPLTVAELIEFFVKANVDTGNSDEDTARAWVPDEIFMEWTYPSDISFDTVGIYKSGDYQITLVLNKALAGFQLFYNVNGLSSWLVEPELYDKCLVENNGVFSSTYNTSVDTTLSFGPYKIVSYQADKAMRFERNDNWYGYKDGKHVYVDPTDGKTYPMYQSTAIDTQKVEEASTRKLMFLKGELATYGLQAEDFASYRSSDYCYTEPDETIFFLILNGHKEAIANREAAADFDKANVDLETMTLLSFRKAIAVTYDKELFAATISPQRSGGYGIIGTKYIYDPETGARYRDTDQAKQVLCDFYSVDTSKFANLDDAVNSITGFDPEAAKVLYKQAFDEAIEKGFITDADGDGISDQTVTIEYCLGEDSDFMTKTVDYLNEKMNEVTAGTPFAGKVQFVKSAPYGNDWSNKLKAGLSDTVLAGWSGSMMNPFNLTDLYTNPAYQYDGKWFDSSTVDLTLTVPVDGADTEVTMSLNLWSDALNGETVTVNGKDYNFGEGLADVETRLDILAGIEGEVLKTYDYLPMLQNAGMHLLSQQMFYVVEEYNPIMGRGGVQYLKYNYNDTEWADYVKEQGGELKY